MNGTISKTFIEKYLKAVKNDDAAILQELELRLAQDF